MTNTLDIDFTVYKPCDGSVDVDDPNPGIGDSDGVIINDPDPSNGGLAESGPGLTTAVSLTGAVLLLTGVGLLATSRRRV